MTVSDATVSDLTGLTLMVLHWDERGGELTALYEGPTREPFTVDTPEHDHVRVRLSLVGVTHYEVRGWTHDPVESITESPTPDGVEVLFTTPTSTIRCAATTRTITALPSYRATTA